MAQISLYYRTQLESKVSLLPEQINGNMDDHMLKNLKDKIEGRTIDNGIVLKIMKLISYDFGMIAKSNFSATVVFPVKYECFICSPVKNLEIVCVLENIVKGYLIARNGPVIIVIQFNNIDAQKFGIKENVIISTKNEKPIEKGDHLKVSIININNNLGEKNIVAMCKLLSLAGKDEIEEFGKDQRLVIGENMEEDKKFI